MELQMKKPIKINEKRKKNLRVYRFHVAALGFLILFTNCAGTGERDPYIEKGIPVITKESSSCLSYVQWAKSSWKKPIDNDKLNLTRIKFIKAKSSFDSWIDTLIIDIQRNDFGKNPTNRYDTLIGDAKSDCKELANSVLSGMNINEHKSLNKSKLSMSSINQLMGFNYITQSAGKEINIPTATMLSSLQDKNSNVLQSVPSDVVSSAVEGLMLGLAKGGILVWQEYQKADENNKKFIIETLRNLKLPDWDKI